MGDGAIDKTYWSIVYSSGFKLLKGDTIIANLTVGVPYTYNNVLTVQINSIPAGVADGYRWKFTVYPINKDISLDDYTMPRVHPNFNYIDLTVNEQA